MRLTTAIPEEYAFAQWQLEVGHKQHTSDSDDITLPSHFHCSENTVNSLISTIYPNIDQPVEHPETFFAQRTILSGKNDNVDSLNHTIINKFPGQLHVYHSADSLAGNSDNTELLYPPEYLNSINCSGLPLAKLNLKVGCPVMVLRNLNPGVGICNGSSAIIT